MKKRSGFTLIEMLLSVACLAIISIIAIPVYQSFQVKNDLGIATNSVVQSLRRAQILSQASDGNTTSGVKIQTSSITVFRGASYVARDTTMDEIFEVPTSITATGTNEIIFSKIFGLPNATGTIILTSYINDSKTITINEKGMVAY
ncbi:MAG: prepilin-type N-terminal cleavage/methylation domain-containing protein [Candidatus Falkowbacteria bacterium]|nr:prepilin-type N-terminal cleavage/methylation domain-containing protein [Candidatus Falkowbacteria bacterium]